MLYNKVDFFLMFYILLNVLNYLFIYYLWVFVFFEIC